jgi:integrase
MVTKPKGRRYYVVRFRFQGKMIQKRTRATNQNDANDIAAKIRSELARGNFGILQPKARLTLGEFLKQHFEPFIKTEHKSKPHTLDYYQQGAKKLKGSDMASLRIDEITGQHVNAYVAQHGEFEECTINRDLRTLRRALHLAAEWGHLDRVPKIVLAKGENRRERILTDTEADRYLASCPQPWRDVATLILGTGMRPGEAHCLDWRNILLNGSGGMIHIMQGKTRAARRLLPMVPRVYAALKARHESQGCPSGGWVFPTGSASGHIEVSSGKIWHAKALAAIQKAHEEKPEENPEVKPFEPYCLRHTALTNLAAAGCDAFTLARIAGHSNIAITMRYVHPETEAVESAFKKLACTKAGYQETGDNDKGDSGKLTTTKASKG